MRGYRLRASGRAAWLPPRDVFWLKSGAFCAVSPRMTALLGWLQEYGFISPSFTPQGTSERHTPRSPPSLLYLLWSAVLWQLF